MSAVGHWGMALTVLPQLAILVRVWISTRARAQVAVERARAAGLRDLAASVPFGGRVRDVRGDGTVVTIAVDHRSGRARIR